jgi:hypothetical protein
MMRLVFLTLCFPSDLIQFPSASASLLSVSGSSSSCPLLTVIFPGCTLSNACSATQPAARAPSSLKVRHFPHFCSDMLLLTCDWLCFYHRLDILSADLQIHASFLVCMSLSPLSLLPVLRLPRLPTVTMTFPFYVSHMFLLWFHIMVMLLFLPCDPAFLAFAIPLPLLFFALRLAAAANARLGMVNTDLLLLLQVWCPPIIYALTFSAC